MRSNVKPSPTLAENLLDADTNAGLHQLVEQAARKRSIARQARALAFAMQTINIAEAELVLRRLRFEVKDGRIASEGIEALLGFAASSGSLIRSLLVSRALKPSSHDGYFELVDVQESVTP
jgi:hypothetical protein